MQFSLSQPKLKELMQKLLAGDIFPVSVLMTKDSKVLSIQREEHGRAIRLAKFDTHYFDAITPEFDAVKIDVNTALRLINHIPSSETVLVEKVGNKLCFTDYEGTTFLHYEDHEKPFADKLPFDIKEGVPYVGEGKLPLTTAIQLELADIKKASKYAHSLHSEFFHFFASMKNLSIVIGNLEPWADKRRLDIVGQFIGGEEIANCFTFGISEIAQTFRQQQLTLHTAPNAPGWFAEWSKEEGYQLGILVPPYTEDDEPSQPEVISATPTEEKTEDIPVEIPPDKKPLANAKFCITGTLSQPRYQTTQLIKDIGCKVGGLSKNTNYLIAGKKPRREKIYFAKENGITIITEQKFLEMIELRS